MGGGDVGWVLFNIKVHDRKSFGTYLPSCIKLQKERKINLAW